MLNVKEACELTKYSESYIRKLVMWRKIPFVYVGSHSKRIMFEAKELEQWMNIKEMEVENG